MLSASDVESDAVMIAPPNTPTETQDGFSVEMIRTLDPGDSPPSPAPSDATIENVNRVGDYNRYIVDEGYFSEGSPH